jgi:hypothetical protein
MGGGAIPLLREATFVINAGSAALELIWQVFVNNAYKSSSYLTANTLRSIATTNRLMLFKEIIGVYCENHTEHINTLRGQNAEFFNVKAGGIHSNHCSLWAKQENRPQDPAHLHVHS